MSDIWTPHATVACVVEQNGRFLLVEEISHGERVFNQPAGHIEENESIRDAALRETLEETGWQVELKGLIGLYVYTAPQNGVCYHRYCFSASPIEKVSAQLDQDIISEHWLTIEEIEALGEQLRSPLVLKCIYDFIEKAPAPLEMIYEHKSSAENLRNSS